MVAYGVFLPDGGLLGLSVRFVAVEFAIAEPGSLSLLAAVTGVMVVTRSARAAFQS